MIEIKEDVEKKDGQEIIFLTLSAHKHIRESLLAGYHLRLAVKGGGCSGMSYVCEGEESDKKTEFDTVIPYDTFDIVIDRKAIIYLKGMELDYSGGLGGTGFQFTNPLATSTCGCGESFSVT